MIVCCSCGKQFEILIHSEAYIHERYDSKENQAKCADGGDRNAEDTTLPENLSEHEGIIH